MTRFESVQALPVLRLPPSGRDAVRRFGLRGVNAIAHVSVWGALHVFLFRQLQRDKSSNRGSQANACFRCSIRRRAGRWCPLSTSDTSGFRVVMTCVQLLPDPAHARLPRRLPTDALRNPCYWCGYSTDSEAAAQGNSRRSSLAAVRFNFRAYSVTQDHPLSERPECSPD